MLFSTIVSISDMSSVIWVLVVSQVVVLGVDAAEMAVDVVHDVTVERRGLGCKTGGWGINLGAVDRPGRECR